MDGPEEIHDRYRQKGSFKRAMRAIDILSENDISVSVISTLHSNNVRFLEEMYEILKDKGIFAWQLPGLFAYGERLR